MARLPMYQQQTVMDAPRASGAEFGGQVGQAMAQTGNVLQDIGVTMKRREDVIDRTVRARDFDAFAQEALRALETQDLARAETVDQYRQGLSAKMQEVLDAHPGTTASKAEFKNQLLNQMHQYERGAREAQIKAQHTLLGQIVEERTNQIATQIAFAPELMDQGFEELDAQINQFSGALPAGEVDRYRKSGRSNMIATALYAMRGNGLIDEPEAILKNPEYNKYLNPDQSRRFILDIAADKGKRTVESQRVDANVNKWKAILKDEWSPEKEAIVRSLPPKSERGPIDDIAEWSMLNPGKMVPQNFIDAAYNFVSKSGGADGGTFGNSLEGRSLEIVTRDAPLYAAGMLGSLQERQFEAAVEVLQQDKTYNDPITRMPVTVPGRLPSFVQEALLMRGRGGAAPRGAAPGAPAARPSAPSQGGMTDIPGFEGQGLQDGEGNQFSTGPDGQMRPDYFVQPEEGQAPAGAGQQPRYETVTPGMKTANMSMFELAPFVTGPIAKAATGIVGRIPGRPVDVDPRYREAQTRMNMIHERATFAMRPEGKIADQYRQELSKITDLKGKVFDNAENYWQHVVGLDAGWRGMLKELDKIASGETLATDTGTREAVDLGNLLRFVIREFNVPQVRVYNRQQLEKLPPGTPVFIGDSYEPNMRK